ncbi:hypothetical protein VTN02DRAFT_5420 [Thermoascus thermophilus]
MPSPWARKSCQYRVHRDAMKMQNTSRTAPTVQVSLTSGNGRKPAEISLTKPTYCISVYLFTRASDRHSRGRTSPEARPGVEGRDRERALSPDPRQARYTM